LVESSCPYPGSARVKPAIARIRYSDPEFSWKFAVPPGGIGFLASRGLGPQYANDLFAGAATPKTLGSHLFRFNLTGNRRRIAVDDRRLEDRVAGPNGNLFVVSLSDGAVYEIFRR
jgi:hypothetical protein